MTSYDVAYVLERSGLAEVKAHQEGLCSDVAQRTQPIVDGSVKVPDSNCKRNTPYHPMDGVVIFEEAHHTHDTHDTRHTTSVSIDFVNKVGSRVPKTVGMYSSGNLPVAMAINSAVLPTPWSPYIAWTISHRNMQMH